MNAEAIKTICQQRYALLDVRGLGPLYYCCYLSRRRGYLSGRRRCRPSRVQDLKMLMVSSLVSFRAHLLTAPITYRQMSCVQDLSLPQSENDLQNQSRVLPPHVRFLRRTHLLARSRSLPCRWVPSYAAEEQVQGTNLCRYQDRAGV